MNCFLSSSCVVLREAHLAHGGFRWKCSWNHRGNWVKGTTYLLKVEGLDGSGHGCNCIWRNSIPPGGGECPKGQVMDKMVKEEMTYFLIGKAESRWVRYGCDCKGQNNIPATGAA